GDRVSVRRFLLSFALLWLAGAALRLTVLAVPPVLPAIHADLNLSETEVGILTGLPSLLFALAAVPGSLLIARLGPARRRAQRALALRRHHRDGRRHRHRAAGDAAGGARVVAGSHRLCHRG